MNGEPEKVDEDRAKEILSLEDIEVEVDLGLGSQEAKYWTCDLSYVSHSLCWCRLAGWRRLACWVGMGADGSLQDYVKINGDYRS